MKKIFAFLLVAAMLVSMFAVTSVAADYSWELDGVDIAVEEGYVVVCTSLDKWAESNPSWSMNLQCTPEGDGYKVVAISSCPIQDAAKEAGEWNDSSSSVNEGYTPSADELKDASGFSDTEGDIYVIAHGGNDNQNVWQLGVGMDVELVNIEAGETITFSGTASASSPYDRIGRDNNVAAGKSYTTSIIYAQDPDNGWAHNDDLDPTYPDTNNRELTDGKVPGDKAYDNSHWVGLHGKSPDVDEANGGVGYCWAVIDLEEVTDIIECAVYVPGAGFEAGVIPPYFVKFQGSVDGENWEELGHFEEADIQAEVGNFSDNVTELSVACETSVRYVRVELSQGGWVFVGEVAVIGAEPVDNGDDNTDNGDDNTNNDDGDEPVAPVVPEDPTIKIEMGEANENASFVADITVPESYVAGEEVIVTVTIKDITATTGLHTVKFNLLYDNDKLEVNQRLGEQEELLIQQGAKNVTSFKGYAEWEDLSRYELSEDGTKYISVGAGTAGGDTGLIYTAANADGQLVFEISFTAKETATGGIAVAIPHASVAGTYVDGVTSTVTDYVGNGDEDVIAMYKDPTPDEPTDDQPTTNKPGDASSMIFFAIIALVAVAGSAVVIKTRK